MLIRFPYFSTKALVVILNLLLIFFSFFFAWGLPPGSAREHKSWHLKMPRFDACFLLFEEEKTGSPTRRSPETAIYEMNRGLQNLYAIYFIQVFVF